MASVDDKVVAISFETSKFQTGVATVLSGLDKLKAALQFPNAGKGLDDVNAAAKRTDFSKIHQGLDDIKNKFSAMSVVALSVLANVANKAVMAGASIVKSLTLDPVSAGFREYEQNLNAVQTILANTQASGAKLKDVNAALKELNQYADKTIYNFGQMARNIGTFTAAGVDLKTSTAAIKGIANLAALSGSNAEQASTAMYQLSQAISTGAVKLQDWNSVVNAGMGGTVFQRALAQTAEKMGTLKEGTVKLTGPMKNVSIAGESFRQSLAAKPGEQGWLTSEVLTKTLKQFTGDMTDAQLAAEGFSEAQIKAIQLQAKTALNAATKVKTLTGVLETAKEAAGSGWAETWQIIFGDFGEAKILFTSVSNAINGFISASADARNKVLDDWKELGGRTILIRAIKDVFQALGAVIKPIKEAFREIFPAKTGKDLLALTKQFADFAKTLKIGPETADNLRRSFAGFFAMLSIGKQIVQGILSVIGHLFGQVKNGSGGFLDLTAAIGDWWVALDKSLKKGKSLSRFFDSFGEVLAVPIEMLQALGSLIGGIFKGFSGGDAASKSLDKVGASADALTSKLEGIQEFFANLGQKIGEAMRSADWSAVFSAINVGLLGGILVILRKFMTKGIPLDFAGGLLSNLSKSFGALTGSLTAMQNNIRADTLQKLAIAIGILAASVVALSFVNPEDLQKSLTALAVGFGLLLGAMKILSEIGSVMATIRMPFIVASLVGLSIAIGLLSFAVAGLAQLSWEQLAKGLGSVVVLLIALSAAAVPLSANSKGMIQAGVGIAAMAIGINLLATAVAIFATMDLKELGKGLGAVAVSLGIIAAGMRLMPKGMIASAAGLLIVAGAMNILAVSMKIFASMSWEDIGRGIVALAGSLVVLAVAMHAMQGTLLGAAALAVAASSLALLAPALKLLGTMQWSDIIRGLTALAGALIILGVAGALIQGVSLGLITLGGAIFLVGAGVALFGVGINLIAHGLAVLAKAGPTAIGILVGALEQLLEALPVFVEGVIKAVLAAAEGIAKHGPAFATAIGKIIVILAEAIVKAAPQLVKAFDAIVAALIQIILNNSPKIIAAGLQLVLDLLKGITQNAKELIAGAVSLIIEFVGAIASQANRVIAAGLGLVVAIVKGIVNNINKVITAALSIITAIVDALVRGVGQVVTAGGRIITGFLTGISNNISKVVSKGADIVINFITGIGSKGAQLATAAADAVGRFITAAGRAALKLVKTGAEAAVKFVEGIERTLKEERYAQRMTEAGIGIGEALISGVIKGLANKAGDLVSSLGKTIGKLPGAAKKFLGISSPSKVFAEIGGFMMQGLAVGIEEDDSANKAMANMSYGLINGVKDIFEITSPSKVMTQLGRYIGEGFANGIKGSSADISNAFTELNQKLNDALATARQTIATEQDKLDRLREAKKPDMDAIKKAKEAIEQNEALLQRVLATKKLLSKELDDDESKLRRLANQYVTVTEKLKEAQSVLDEAIRTRDQAFTSFTDQYGSLPDIDTEAPDALGTYQAALQSQVLAVGAYQHTLAQLRKLGLDDATYQKLLEEGTGAQQFANQLLAGGKDAVAGLNTLDAQLNTQATILGTNASKTLYQAGVDSAQGIVNGLASQQGEINKQMEKIATSMIKALKKKLKIKSPSQVFAELGSFVSEGLAVGLNNSTKLVTDAVTGMADAAVDAMQGTISRISASITDNINVNPVITPVLDLALVQEEAKKLADLSNVIPITAAASYGQAASISASQNTVQTPLDSDVVAAGGTQIKFEQNNYSPESLTPTEIYRQTKNQLSQAKTALQLV